VFVGVVFSSVICVPQAVILCLLVLCFSSVICVSRIVILCVWMFDFLQ
jgi:hypothetical protein